MGEAVALFSQIRIHIAQENWQSALNDLNRIKDMKNLGGIRIAGGTNIEEVTFLRGFVLEKLGRLDEAIDVYKSFGSDYKNYYSWRSIEHLRELSKNEKVSQKIKSIKPIVKVIPQDVVIPNEKLLEFGRKDIWQTPQKIKSHKTIADELLFLGLYDEATPELETALRKDLQKNTGSLSDFSVDTAFTLAVFYKRGDMANRSISYIEPRWKKVPNDYPMPSIPREHLELLYPKPYEESLVRYGKEYNVDPRFLLSIMRQESRFQADVKSVAAARGLMQFISTTANQMADEMKIEGFRQDDLYNPPTAVRFGSHYISKIFKDFPNQPPAVAASYNGGEDRMMRWFKRANSDDPDRYVPEVIFSQTKDYVYKVMTNYRIYKLLYDGNLRKIDK
jgi:soluble lytic murein transglycosylase